MEGAIADDFAGAVVEGEHRREAEVDAAGAQLGGQHVAGCRRRFQGAGGIRVPQRAQRAHRRQHGEAVAEALHAAAVVVDGDQQRRLSQGMNLESQFLEDGERLEIALEQDDAADQRMPQELAFLIREARPRQVEHQRAERQGSGHGLSSSSTTTKARAVSASSLRLR